LQFVLHGCDAQNVQIHFQVFLRTIEDILLGGWFAGKGQGSESLFGELSGKVDVFELFIAEGLGVGAVAY
jgi:hypothetical protein